VSAPESPVAYGDSSFGEAVASRESISSSSSETNVEDDATETAH
jgi:hypothetical protein